MCFDCAATVVFARRELFTGAPAGANTARDLGKASYVTSFSGVVVAFIIVFVILIVVSRQFVIFSSVEFLMNKFIADVDKRIDIILND